MVLELVSVKVAVATLLKMAKAVLRCCSYAAPFVRRQSLVPGTGDRI